MSVIQGLCLALIHAATAANTHNALSTTRSLIRRAYVLLSLNSYKLMKSLELA